MSDALLRQLQKPILPQWQPPIGSFFQDPIQQVTLAGVSPFTSVFSFTVPADRQCVIRKFAITSNDPSAAANVSWQFVVDESAHYNYNAPPTFLGTLDEPTDVFVYLEQQRKFDLKLANAGVVAISVFFRLTFWHWSDRVPLQHPGDETAPLDGGR